MRENERSARRRRQIAILESVPQPQICMMADYEGPPLWGSGAERILQELPSAIRERLERWAGAYGQWALPYDPSAEEIDAFEHEGIAVWQQLREELAGRVFVIYYSAKRHELVAHPEDLFAEQDE